MSAIEISEDTYRDKVAGCWLGKNIGGTLGEPYETQKTTQDLDFYDPVPTEPAANDDLDLQLVWLKMLQERGLYPSVGDFADYWIKHLGPYPWNEYGFCRRNLDRGLRPPISGCFENYYIDEMGSPIRSEIWACVAPGDPDLAAALAWSDAVLDHSGGEGMYGEMFWAALESAAFVISDPKTLIQIGLNMIPCHSRIHRAIKDALWCHENGVSWKDAREQTLHSFGSYQPCSAPQNHAFTVIGWLYGDDFGDRLCSAVNCGYDTDCTGATLGSVLGIVGSRESIPRRWVEPISEQIVLHKFTANLDAPADIDDLTDQTTEIGRRMLSERSDQSSIAAEDSAPDNVLSRLYDNTLALAALRQDPLSTIERVEGYDLALHYHGDPVIRPGIEKLIGVSVRKDLELVDANVEIDVPEGWNVQKRPDTPTQVRFAITADEVGGDNYLSVTAWADGTCLENEYLILGPQNAQGFPCSVNVERCPECGARVESCICE